MFTSRRIRVGGKNWRLCWTQSSSPEVENSQLPCSASSLTLVTMN